MVSDIDTSKLGTYRVELNDGQKLEAWFNPSTGHWKEGGKEIGFMGLIHEQKIISAEYLGDYYEC